MNQESQTAQFLVAKNVVKHYGGVVALADGSIDVRAGEVVALVGANGSGKSTLSKIITGVVAPDHGELLHKGQAVSFSSPLAARRRGIVAVYQELSLVPRMSIAENIWLGHELFQWNGLVRAREMRRRTRQLLELFAGIIDPAVEPDMRVDELSPSDKQIVEILKAFSLQPELMILDEATASLDSRQVQRLFELVDDWKQAGMAIVFISHRLEEIYRVADRVTVLRSGRTMASASVDELPRQQLVELMIEGGAVERINHQGEIAGEGEARLAVKNLSTDVLHGVDLEVRSGELVGLGGLQGQGQSDLLLALFGAISYKGSITIAGQEIHLTNPPKSMRHDIAYVPGDRNVGGLLSVRSILENLMLPNWDEYGALLQVKRARRDAEEIASSGLGLVMAGLDEPVSSLSGGNAQKVVIGKWLLRNPKVMLLDDPTKGVDVGAKGEFYRILSDLRAGGAAILFYSSDDDELLGLCDRVLVFHDGQITDELFGERLRRSDLVAAAMGGTSSKEVVS